MSYFLDDPSEPAQPTMSGYASGLEAIARSYTRLARAGLEADATFFSVAAGLEEQYVVVDTAANAPPLPSVLPLTASPNAPVLLSGVCVELADPTAGPSAEAPDRFGYGAWLAMPVQMPEGPVLGCLGALRQRGGAWSPAEQETLKGMAVTLAAEIRHGGFAGKLGSMAALPVLTSMSECLIWQAEVIDTGESRCDWRVQVFNEAAAQRFLPLELKAGETYAQAWTRCCLPEDLEQRRETAGQAVRSGSSFCVEFRCVDRHGQVRWLRQEVQVQPIGAARWLAIGLCVDVTEFRSMEATLRQREHQFSAVVENLMDVLTIVDASTIIRYESPSVEEILGYRPEERIGTQALNYVHPEDVPQLLEFLERYGTQQGARVSHACRVRHRDGSWCDLEFSAKNLLHDPSVSGIIIISRDVTASKRAEEALRRSEERLRRFVESARVVPWEYDAETECFPYVSPRLRDLVGIDPSAWTTLQGWVESIHPEDRAAARQQFLNGLQQIGSYELEYRLRAADGRLIWVRHSVSVRWSEHGKLVDGFLFDITASKETEDRLRYVIAGARCLLWDAVVEERDGRYVWQTRVTDETAADRFLPLRRQPDQPYVNALYEHSHPEDVPRLEATSREAFQTKQSGYTQEFRCYRADGELRWLREDVRIHPLGFRQWRVVGVSIDITEQKRLEERRMMFQALGMRLNAATTPEEAAHIILQVADELLGWDSAWLELRESDTYVSRMVAMFDVIDGQRTKVESASGTQQYSGALRRVAETGAYIILRQPEEMEAARQEVRGFFGDVQRLSASILCVPLRSGADIIGALSIQSYSHSAYQPDDLELLQALADYCAGALERANAEAARRRLEEQLRQSQKLEAVGRIAGGVAHDFNNMLAVINGYSELLRNQVDPESPTASGLEEIRQAGERAASLTRQLLAFSRAQLLEPVVLDLAEVVSGLEKMLCRVIGEDVVLRTTAESGLGKVKADRSQVEQVLLNLVVNSRDAMPQGGEIHVQLCTVPNCPSAVCPEREVAPGSYVLLTVTDTGCGIAPEVMEHIFEPFFTTKPNGTGLGLSTVFGIVNQSGGCITVESTQGEGSTFSVYLPCVPEAERPQTRAVEPSSGYGSETVLVVEDEDLVRGLVCHVLEMHGYTVLAAENGDEALRLVEQAQAKLDLLLTDVVMPGSLNGRALSECLLKEQPGLKVLYMSGYTDDAVVRHGVQQAEVAFIQKPFTPQVLVQKVREVLEQGVATPRYLGAVLLVDDDDAARESLGEVLQDAGYTVWFARDGHEALRSLQEGLRPDVILLDLVMPGMNGWVFRTEQRKDAELAQIPVVVMSGHQDPEPAAEFLNAEEYLAKPLDLPRLLALLERLMRKRANVEAE